MAGHGLACCLAGARKHVRVLTFPAGPLRLVGTTQNPRRHPPATNRVHAAYAQRTIRRQDVPRAGQVLAGHPGEVGYLDRLGDLAGREPARVHEHDQIERRIRVKQDVPHPSDDRRHTKLLAQLAFERRDGCLAGFDLAAGKLPLQR